jgi:hypothetical protein
MRPKGREPLDPFEVILGAKLPSEQAVLARGEGRLAPQRHRRILQLLIAVLIAALVVLGYNLAVKVTPDGKCWRLDSYSCWDLSPEFISRTTGVDLPQETSVRDSGTAAWLSWWLSATVVLPEGQKLPNQGNTKRASITPGGRSNGQLVYKIRFVEHGSEPWPTP